MTISDPAQLLKRIPELELFVTDRAIKRAIESGDPFKVYRALIWAKLQRRHPKHRDTINLLIRNRRLFSKPLKGVPSLSTINSVGFSFVGESERDSDGSYIALHAIVILFAIPIVPLGSFLVSKTGSRQWKIYTRVPIGIAGWLYSRGLALLLLLSILVGAANGWQKSRNQDLMVLNGFSTPLDVVIGEQKQTIPAEGRVVFNVPVGNVTGRATSAKAGLIDSYQHVVNSHRGYSIWNIAGATPLALETVNYYKTTPATPTPNAQTVYCGQHDFELDSVDFAFVEPPQKVSMDRYATQTSKSYLDVYHDDKRHPFEICLAYLNARNQLTQTATLTNALAQLNDWDINFTSAAVFYAGNTSMRNAVALAKRAADAKPNSVDLQRLYQITRDSAGDYATMLAEYKSNAQQQPDSAIAQYLYAVLLSGSEGLAEMQRLAAKFPQEPRILRALAWEQSSQGDFAGTIESYARLKLLSPGDASNVLGNELEALVAKKRTAEALREISESFHKNARQNLALDASDYALVAQSGGAKPDDLIVELEKSYQDPTGLDLIRIRAGYAPAHATSDRPQLINLALALRNDPAKAMRIAGSLSAIEISRLQLEQRALLYCEAVRANNSELADRMRLMLQLTSNDRQFLQQYIAGSPGSLGSTNLELPFKAAADLARSRNTALPIAERNQLRERAGQEDVLHTVISTALNQWPT